MVNIPGYALTMHKKCNAFHETYAQATRNLGCKFSSRYTVQFPEGIYYTIVDGIHYILVYFVYLRYTVQLPEGISYTIVDSIHYILVDFVYLLS